MVLVEFVRARVAVDHGPVVGVLVDTDQVAYLDVPWRAHGRFAEAFPVILDNVIGK